MKKRKRRPPPITMPKRNKKKIEPVELIQSRAALSQERREEEEYSFNKYAKKSVKFTVVMEAEEIKDLKRKRTRR